MTHNKDFDLTPLELNTLDVMMRTYNHRKVIEFLKEGELVGLLGIDAMDCKQKQQRAKYFFSLRLLKNNQQFVSIDELLNIYRIYSNTIKSRPFTYALDQETDNAFKAWQKANPHTVSKQPTTQADFYAQKYMPTFERYIAELYSQKNKKLKIRYDQMSKVTIRNPLIERLHKIKTKEPLPTKDKKIIYGYVNNAYSLN